MNSISVFRYFVIAGLINTCLFAFLLLTKKKNTTAAAFLIAFMLLTSFQALLNAFDNRSFFLNFPHLSRISWLLPSLFGPLLYLFAKKLLQEENRICKEDLIHFIPFAFYFGLLTNWFFKTAAQKRILLDNFDELSKLDFGWLTQLSMPLVLFYLLLILKEVRTYRRSLENMYSEISTRRMEWLQRFVYLTLAILAVTVMGFYGRKWNIPLLTNFYHYNYALIVLLIYWMAYKCIIQPELLYGSAEVKKETTESSDPPGEVPEEPEQPLMVAEKTTVQTKKYVKSGLDTAAATLLYQKLLQHMETNKPFLEPDLTIYMLAEQLNTKRHYVSQVINEIAEKTFFDFINSYRVEEVKKKLADQRLNNRNIMGIALDCGFNSKATFNNAFKKYTGMTPSAYQNTHT